MGGGPPGFRPGFTCPTLLGCPIRSVDTFRVRGYHPLRLAFQSNSATYDIGNFCRYLGYRSWVPRPLMHNAPRLTCTRFRLCPVRSPLLWTSKFLSLPGGTKMFQFPPFTSADYAFTDGRRGIDPRRVSAFGDPRIKGCLHLPEAYRS